MKTMTSRTLDTYCVDCDEEVKAELESRPDSINFRGERVNYTATVAVCPLCHRVIADSRAEHDNLECAYAAYRQAHDILAPGEIKALRERYGLSLRAFSAFLGFGEQTVARYESGSMPDEAHNATLKLASTTVGASALLEARRPALSDRVIEAVERFIEHSRDASEMESLFSLVRNPALAHQSPDVFNGFRCMDISRAAAAVHELAARCADLYWTKLQKALYFTDALAFELRSRSMTGIRYAHATYGPVAEERDALRFVLERDGVIEMKQATDWGEVVLPGRTVPQALGADDIAVIDKVARFVNTFPNASALSEYSHKLNSWRGTNSGEAINYTSNVGEVGKVIDDRLGETR